MGIGLDPSPALEQYTHPNKLVTSAWLGARLGTPGLKVVESNEDSLLYDIGHIPTATRINWAKHLNDPIRRDFISAKDFEELMDDRGISRDDTVVIYGDRSNLWAVYTLWVFELFGHPDVRLLDGGRDAWMQEEKETSYDVPTSTTSGYKVERRDDHTNRIFVDELRGCLDSVQLLDLRDPEGFAGETHESKAAPERHATVSRAGHIPGATNIAMNTSLHPNSRFRSRAELDEAHAALDPSLPTVTYCTSGARAAHQWFTLKYLMGWNNVRVYDGSWIEWGNMVRVPVAQGPAT
ncbi:Putative thiosulfate sulfurtransferase SseA [Corynebacterium urogenitale]|uniref:Sulfurtransferase n=1 Tax=Corynebacterium urogenitale TaxID=2487892 RepID=A0A5J6Z9J8_9CORY|nr:sulfurtransferase [Corynebacterium urogenitale]QFQ02991.1 Putative thiosulfate sulfurtransferase SseA [Corynebacterium urogenitale]